MKNSIKVILAIGLVLPLAFSACKKEDSGDSRLNISAGIVNGSSTVNKFSLVQSGNLVFDTGYVWVREIVFDGEMDNNTSISKTVERFSKIDFVSGVANPSLDDVIIPAGTYTSVNLGVELRDEDNQPAIMMWGTYTRSDNSVVPIRFEFNSGEVFEAESSGTATVQSDEVATARITFDPSVWFSVVSANQLDNANTNNDGVLVVSENMNSAIFDAVADRLDISTQAEFQ